MNKQYTRAMIIINEISLFLHDHYFRVVGDYRLASKILIGQYCLYTFQITVERNCPFGKKIGWRT